MNKEQQQTTILWMKRLAATLTIAVWLYAMSVFLQKSAPFAELAPYCMGSTMLIFGVLTSIFKALEYWEKQIE